MILLIYAYLCVLLKRVGENRVIMAFIIQNEYVSNFAILCPDNESVQLRMGYSALCGIVVNKL
jgi:hypothetical protein